VRTSLLSEVLDLPVFCVRHPLVIHSMPIPGAGAVALLPRPPCHGQRGAAGAISTAIARPERRDEGMGIFSEIFSWWGGNTWSNRIYTALRGKLVGTDATGNRYYVQSRGVGPLGVPRRWVIYRTLAEASQVPPEWHGWLHFLVDEPPTAETYVPRPWQKPHRMNMTGTPEAYRPPGSILASGKRPEATGDYKPWKPR
jgi:NADH:ubiquinone oxidoreductase subunit